MEEEDMIRSYFQKAGLQYDEEGIEEAVLQKVRKKPYQKKANHYTLAGKVGLACCLLLSLLFLWSLGNSQSAQNEVNPYYWLGAPLILMLLWVQLEFWLGVRGNKVV